MRCFRMCVAGINLDFGRFGVVRAERPQIGLLRFAPYRIAQNQRRKILDLDEGVILGFAVAAQCFLQQGAQIQPLAFGLAFERPIKQIQSVDICDDSFHFSPLK